MRLAIVGLSLALLSLVPALFTQALAQGQRVRLVGGVEAHHRVKQLTSDIRWHESLASAQAAARRNGKLIFFVHMRGDLDGKT